MSVYKVVMLRDAIADLKDMRVYLEDKAGTEITVAYIARIEAFCHGLSLLPERGLPRNDIRPGLRVAIFEGRITIAYRISGFQVVILRVLGAGRDVNTILSDYE